jgi:hypothetical protein
VPHKPAPFVRPLRNLFSTIFAASGGIAVAGAQWRIAGREKAAGSEFPAWLSGPLQIGWAEERRE